MCEPLLSEIVPVNPVDPVLLSQKTVFDMNPTRPQHHGVAVFSGGPHVVGIVDSLDALRAARRLKSGAVDFLEWRADFLGTGIVDSAIPWVVTVRHPAEGGANGLPLARRRAMALELLPKAAVLDIEVRSLTQMGAVLDAARGAGVAVLASFHDFRATPSAARLRETLRRAADAGADAVKIATVTESAADLARLLDLFGRSPLPLAVMGMGRLGMASRVALAAAGSVLNYGWIDRPNVPGQWAARELRELLVKCVSRS